MLLRPFGAMNGCCGIRGDGMRRGTAGAPRNAGTEFASGPSGIAGHAAGAGVLGCATNRPERSVFAVVGGCPVSFAGASAHQTRWPRKSRVAIRPCNGSFSEYAPNPRMVILSAVIVTDRTGPPPTRELRKAYPLG